jgi:type VI protein secretion system component VasK
MANITGIMNQADLHLDELEKLILESKGNLTALRTIQAPSFVASPELRGTTTILWSCIVTLIACIYTALHLNVPGDTGTWRMLANKSRWVLIGLIAPEVVLYLASSQFLEARRLSRELTSMYQKAHAKDEVKTHEDDDEKVGGSQLHRTR